MWPYVKSYVNLAGHPKFKQLCKTLHISDLEAMGHLHFLWHWCATYARDGNLRRYSIAVIAEESRWQGDPQAWVDALLSAGGDGRAGFLDMLEDGSYQVHDWNSYYSGADSYREANRRRQQAFRERQRQQSDSVTSRNVSNARRIEENNDDDDLINNLEDRQSSSSLSNALPNVTHSVTESLQQKLWIYGFTDAPYIVATYDPELIEAALNWVTGGEVKAENPGALLRKIITTGKVPKGKSKKSDVDKYFAGKFGHLVKH